jgi:F420-non-reducing hydrogenase iron-sulfur subunit
MLADMGIEPERVRLEWISAAEGEKVKRVINEMTETVRQLGPLGIPQKFAEWDKEMEQFAAHVEVGEALKTPCAEHAPTQESAHV